MSKQVHEQEEIFRLRGVIGPRLRQARKAMSITQEQAAKLIDISAEFYARVERGHALPSVPTIHKMADALYVTVDHLLGIDVLQPPLPRPPSSIKPRKESRQITRIVDQCRDNPELRRLVVALIKLCERDGPSE